MLSLEREPLAGCVFKAKVRSLNSNIYMQGSNYIVSVVGYYRGLILVQNDITGLKPWYWITLLG